MKVAVLAGTVGLLLLSRGNTFLQGDRREVDLVRVPDRGIQPEAVVDDRGVTHVLYFRGEPAAGDLFYVRSTDAGGTFSTPIRVNSQPGSAIATGTIRGGQMAIGREGRTHVAWNGSDAAVPKGLINPASGQPTAPFPLRAVECRGHRVRTTAQSDDPQLRRRRRRLDCR
jgi:hypothetical protein